MSKKLKSAAKAEVAAKAKPAPRPARLKPVALAVEEAVHITASASPVLVPPALAKIAQSAASAGKIKSPAKGKTVATPAALATAGKDGTADKSSKSQRMAKPKKPKLVRDSFTIPKDEFVVLDDLKARALRADAGVKKSELLRAGIKALAAMNDTAFAGALAAVPTLKTGRPPLPADLPADSANLDG